LSEFSCDAALACGSDNASIERLREPPQELSPQCFLQFPACLLTAKGDVAGRFAPLAIAKRREKESERV
jgi:hypothetical protein